MIHQRAQGGAKAPTNQSVLRHLANDRVQGCAEEIRTPPQPLGPGGPGPLTNGLGGLGLLTNGAGGPGPLGLWPQGLRGPLAYIFRGPGPLEYG